MNYCALKHRHLVALLILIVGTFLATESPSQAQPPPTSRIRIVSATDKGLILEFTSAELAVEQIDLDGQPYQRLTIPGTVLSASPGEPELPVLGTLLGVPNSRDITLSILEAESEVLNGFRLPPSPNLIVEGNDLATGDLQTIYSPKPAIYQQDVPYPASPVKVGFSGLMRDQPVAQIQFSPIQYYPLNREIRHYHRLVVEVGFLGMGQSLHEGRAEHPVYESLLNQALLNYDSLSRPLRESVTAPVPDAPVTSKISEITFSDLKLEILEDGLYTLTFDDLTTAGWNLSNVDPRKIQLHQQGNEIPLYLPGEHDGVFQPTDRLFFYGRRIDTPYTARNVYWLSVGTAPGRRMVDRDGAPSGTAQTAAHFLTTLHAEEESEYWVTMPEGEGQDHWFWGEKFNAPEARHYTLSLNHISNAVTTATLRVNLKGHTEIAALWPDHHTELRLNGADIDGQTWDGLNPYTHTVAIPQSLLQNGNNTLRLNGTGDTGAVVDQFFLNWIDLAYWDTYVAEDDRLFFGPPESGPFEFEITGFSSDQITIFDISEPDNPVRLTNVMVTPTGGSFKAEFEDTAQADSRYLALTSDAYQTADTIQADVASTWRAPAHGADYLVITHRDFFSHALRLANHRAAQGMRTATIDVDDLYDEFSDGLFTPQAIRDFLSYAYQNWQSPAPTFVVLLGGATYDYKDHLGLARKTLVPTQIIETDLLGQTPSDNWFVQISGDDVLPDMFIGRLPAQRVIEAEQMVDKLISYDQNPPDDSWNANVLLVADDDTPIFEQISELIIDQLPYYYAPNPVYVDHYPPGNPSNDIKAAINNGSLLVNYTGHGNVNQWGTWSGGNIFTAADANGLVNTNKLPVMTIANCLNGNFASDEPSMAETLLYGPNRGAVGVWAATSLGYPSGHRVLVRAFYRSIFLFDQYALGAATTQAKLATYAQSSIWRELVETFVLFGDPATQLALRSNYPYLKQTTPADKTSQIPIAQTLQIAFSKPMNPASVQLDETVGLTFSPAWDDLNTTLSYSHPDLAYGRTLTFTISGQDGLGNPFGPGLVPSTWSFTTTAPIAPAAISLHGPALGVVQAVYPFSVTIAPITTTQPLTYSWQASGHSPVTHTGGLSDEQAFTWQTSGPKTVTVRATNLAGTISLSKTISLDYAPPTGLSINGPATTARAMPTQIEAVASPFTTTRPITFLWQATGQALQVQTGQAVTGSMTYTWPTVGSKTITVTAINPGGSFSQTAQLMVMPHLTTIAGPTAGQPYQVYTFTASISPITSSVPVTYHWQADEQASITHVNQLQNTVAFTWTLAGQKVISVAASNDDGVSTASLTFKVAIPPAAVALSGPTSGLIGRGLYL